MHIRLHVGEEANYFKPQLFRKGDFKMAKKVAKVVKMELPGGEAKPGPKLASAGVVMPKFCTEFNAKTADRKGQIVPVIITAYEDKTFSMEIKTSPVTGLLLKAAGIEKGSANQKTIVGKVTKAQIREIAEYKFNKASGNNQSSESQKVIYGEVAARQPTFRA